MIRGYCYFLLVSTIFYSFIPRDKIIFVISNQHNCLVFTPRRLTIRFGLKTSLQRFSMAAILQQRCGTQSILIITNGYAHALFISQVGNCLCVAHLGHVPANFNAYMDIVFLSQSLVSPMCWYTDCPESLHDV